MKPVWTLTNTWKTIYKSKCICYIKLGYGNDLAVKWIVIPSIIWIRNPNEADITCLKRLLTLEQKAREEEANAKKTKGADHHE